MSCFLPTKRSVRNIHLLTAYTGISTTKIDGQEYNFEMSNLVLNYDLGKITMETARRVATVGARGCTGANSYRR